MAEGDAVVGWRAREEAVDNGGGRRGEESAVTWSKWRWAGGGGGARASAEIRRDLKPRAPCVPREGSADRPLPRGAARAGPPRLGLWWAGPAKPRGPARRRVSWGWWWGRASEGKIVTAEGVRATPTN